MIKQCNKCNKELGVDMFYSHPKSADGLMGKCKDCAKRLSKENRRSKIGYYLKYDRMRANDPHRIDTRRVYANSERGKLTSHKIKAEWAKRNPEKRKAHNAVSNGLRDGKISRMPCQVCGAEKAQAHHEDYSKPLDVDWVCVSCHAKHHVDERGLEHLTEDEIIRGSKYLQPKKPPL